MIAISSHIARIRPQLWWLLPTALVLVLVGQMGVSALAPAPLDAKAIWAFRPKTLTEASAKAELIVRAQVTAVTAGDDLVATFGAGVPDKHEATQRVVLQVTKILKGQAKLDEAIAIFQLGGTIAGSQVQSFFEDDPKYMPGEEYILLLRRQQTPPGLLIIVAPEGRYRIERDGSVKAMIANAVTAEVATRPAAFLEARLAQP